MMLRRIFYAAAVLMTAALFSFNAQAQDVQAQRAAGARCMQATEIQVERARYSNSQIHGAAVAVEWKIVRQSPTCPIRALKVSALLQTVKTPHAEASTLRLDRTVSPGTRSVHLSIPASKIVIFSASDAKLKITPTVTPIF